MAIKTNQFSIYQTSVIILVGKLGGCPQGFSVRFVYDTSGELIYEKTGTSSKNYIYLGNSLVGIYVGSTLYAVHSDHLGRPEVVTNSSGTVVWKSDNKAYDRSVKVEAIQLNLGFPGQYYDDEKDSWYNIYRDYHPSLGRYLQSDPLGLLSGQLSNYTYVDSNPLIRVDPLGLVALFCEVNTNLSFLFGGNKAYGAVYFPGDGLWGLGLYESQGPSLGNGGRVAGSAGILFGDRSDFEGPGSAVSFGHAMWGADMNISDTGAFGFQGNYGPSYGITMDRTNTQVTTLGDKRDQIQSAWSLQKFLTSLYSGAPNTGSINCDC